MEGDWRSSQRNPLSVSRIRRRWEWEYHPLDRDRMQEIEEDEVKEGDVRERLGET